MDAEISKIDWSVFNADWERIDKRIKELNEELDDLDREREQLQYTRRYLRKMEVTNTAEQSKEGTQDSNVTLSSGYGGVSEFILTFLKNGEKNSKDIITAFAAAAGREYKDVANNISNAINRLKTAKDSKVVGREDPRGRRYGSYLKLKIEGE